MIFNGILFLINILVLAVIYIFLRRRIDKLTDPDRLTDSLSGDLDIILSEINQATERNILVIEDKIRELEGIIQTAEKRITLLKKSVETEKRAEMPAVTRKPQSQLSFNISDKDNEEKAGIDLTYTHLNKMNAMSGLVTSMKVPEKKQSESERLKEKVISLHRSGIDSAVIASNLGVNRGEVELIISLYTQMGNGQA